MENSTKLKDIPRFFQESRFSLEGLRDSDVCLLEEYFELLICPKMTDGQEDRLENLLNLFTENSVLGFCSEFIDYFVEDKFGYLDSSFLKQYENQKSGLREFMFDNSDSSKDDKVSAMKSRTVTLMQAEKVQNILLDEYAGKLTSFSGVGISSHPNGYAVDIFLETPLPDSESKSLPKKIFNVPVRQEVIGEALAY